MTTRMIAVWCPDWPVVSAGTAAGVPPAAPVAVVWANRVVSCSAAARAEGVRRGLRRREAQFRCPALVVLPHEPARDARAFEPVVAAVEELAPGVEVVRPGICAVAARGPSRYFGGDRAAAARLVSHVAGATRVACQVGIADGRFAAGLAARQGEIVPRGGSRAFLAPYPVDTLELPELTDLLRRLGLRTLGAFAALPARDVLARFGPDAARGHRLARGLDERPLASRAPAPELAVQIELDPPVDRVDTAAFTAKALAEELHDRLTRRGLACTRLAIEARTEHGQQLTRVWRHEGALTPAAIADRVRWQLDGWLSGRSRPSCDPGSDPRRDSGSDLGPVDGPVGGTGRAGGAESARDAGAVEGRPTAGVTLLRLVPDEVIRHAGLQLGLWGGLGDTGERASRGMARVQGMLGPDAVVTAVLGGGRDPADRVRLVPWGDERVPARPPDQPWPGRMPAPAPAVVLPQPMPADVLDAAGVSVGVTERHEVTATPARLSVAGGPSTEVVAWAGPWPADERWWDRAAGRCRSRFQLLGADGSAWLLALDAGPGPARWLLEAVYD